MMNTTQTAEQTSCNTCGNSKYAPFRSYNEEDRIVMGCVDGFHTGHLVTPSQSSSWHVRPEAKKIRAALKRGREGKGYRKQVS